MLRVIASLLLIGAPVSAAENPDLVALLSRLEPLRNIFAEPTLNSDHSSVDTLYSTLTNVSGAIYGPNKTGCVVLEGRPWRTGDSRVISGPGGKAKVELLSISAATEDHPAVAEFNIVDSGQHLSVDIRGVETSLDAPADIAAWVLAGRIAVTSDSLTPGRVRLNVDSRECLGTTAAKNSRAGLTLVLLDEPMVAKMRFAPSDYRGRVVVVPLHAEQFEVPFEVAVTPPSKSFIVGSLALTPDGRFIGVLGKGGLLRPVELGITAGSGTEHLTIPYTRRGSIRPEASETRR